MRKRFSVFAAFFISLCAVCAFLILALVLGSMTGETFEQRDQRLLNGWEYTVDFTIKLVRTADGWRFDHFNSTAADEKAPEELMVG